ncbi:MAG TPA: hypothetical protein VJB98_02130 [Candidatus Paceibacterota bacterium]
MTLPLLGFVPAFVLFLIVVIVLVVIFDKKDIWKFIGLIVLLYIAYWLFGRFF